MAAVGAFHRACRLLARRNIPGWRLFGRLLAGSDGEQSGANEKGAHGGRR